MKFQLNLILLMLLSIMACNQEKKPNSDTANIPKPNLPNTLKPNNDVTNALQEKSLDSLWNQLVIQKGGCLTSGAYMYNNRFGAEGCVMDDDRIGAKDWKEFFARPKKELTDFLLKKLPDTTSTQIHTCPCFVATVGEVAVYSLQRIHKKNWYDLDGFMEYAKKKSSGCTNHPQVWLQAILIDIEQRERLIREWKQLIEKD